MAIIAGAVHHVVPIGAEPTPGAQGVVVGYGAGGHPIVRKGWKTVAQVAAALKAPLATRGEKLAPAAQAHLSEPP